MLTTSVNTPSGFMWSEGVTALRRVYEDDGSVLLIHTMTTTSPKETRPLFEEENASSHARNVLAGRTIKQAGWTRLRLDRNHGQTRPRVLVEESHGVVVEASPGCSVSRDRLELIIKMFGEMTSTEDRSLQTLENRMMDATSASKNDAVATILRFGRVYDQASRMDATTSGPGPRPRPTRPLVLMENSVAS